MDLTIDALAKLNHRLRQEKLGVTVVAFIITKQPVHSIDIRALQSRAMLDEFRTIADAMAEQVGEQIFQAAAEGHVPELDSLVEDYWRLRLRRAIQTWRRSEPPGIVSHDLVDDQSDPVLNQCGPVGYGTKKMTRSKWSIILTSLIHQIHYLAWSTINLSAVVMWEYSQAIMNHGVTRPRNQLH